MTLAARLPVVLVCLCLAMGSFYAVRLARLAVIEPAAFSWDLKSRHWEVRQFANGFYPRMALVPEDRRHYGINTVYPPNALPWMWVLSPFRAVGFNQILVAAASVAGLGVVLAFAWFAGRRVSVEGAWLLMAAAFSVKANTFALHAGQYALILNGLMVGSMVLLLRQRVLGAGALWAVALMKPTSALLMGFAFLSWRRAAGLVVAAVVVVASGVVAAGWAGYSIFEVLAATYGQSPLAFTAEGQSLVSVLAAAGVPARMATVAGLAVAAVAMLALRGPLMARNDALLWLAVTGYFSRVCFYHLHYDDVLLVFLLMALLRQWLVDRRAASLVIALGVGATLWLPVASLSPDLPGFAVCAMLWTGGLGWIHTRGARPLPAKVALA